MKPILTWNYFKDHSHRGFILGIVGAIVVVLLSSCAKENPSKSSTSSSPNTELGGQVSPNLDSNLTTDGDDFWRQHPGASVPFYPESLAIMNEYVATHPLNEPSNFRVYFRFHEEAPGQWGGEVWIGYRDNGHIYSGRFTTQNPTGKTRNEVSYRDWYKGLPNAAFNQWFTYQGQRVFHGFFQDPYGAIVVVFDGGIDLNDGQPLSMLTGSIWFKNFKRTSASQYMGNEGEQCWFLLPPSPYECGTFKNAEGRVVTNSALYPNPRDGYKKLGTFGGVSYRRAFGK
ncbi:MAG: hypothetical protein RMK80_01330 [Pseudobdellovibrionaceae bacterium]|nr:hypothetical protein [Pseudobdellovibrionaceae bacterium]